MDFEGLLILHVIRLTKNNEQQQPNKIVITKSNAKSSFQCHHNCIPKAIRAKNKDKPIDSIELDKTKEKLQSYI